MSKRNGGKYFGLAAAAALAALAVKYLKDYTDFKEAAEPDLSNLKDSSDMAKAAVKRTYISIKDKSGVKEAAGDLAKAAGRMAKDAGSVAVTAGKTTVDTVKDIKALYDEDPEAAKSEVIGNLKDMKDDIADSLAGAAEKISSMWKSEEDIVAEELFDPETTEIPSGEGCEADEACCGEASDEAVENPCSEEEACEGADGEPCEEASEAQAEEEAKAYIEDDDKL